MHTVGVPFALQPVIPLLRWRRPDIPILLLNVNTPYWWSHRNQTHLRYVSFREWWVNSCSSICVGEENHISKEVVWANRLSLLWRHNWRDGVPNQQHHDCLQNCSFRPRSKKTSKLCVTRKCFIWWGHHIDLQDRYEVCEVTTWTIPILSPAEKMPKTLHSQYTLAIIMVQCWWSIFREYLANTHLRIEPTFITS